MTDKIYPGCAAMTYCDAKRTHRLNAKNLWGFSLDTLARITREHKKARAAGDVRTMERIEYRLTDANFHHEAHILFRGEYEILMEEIRQDRQKQRDPLF